MQVAGSVDGLARVLKAVRSSGRALCLAGAIALFFWIQWSIVGLQVRIEATTGV